MGMPGMHPPMPGMMMPRPFGMFAVPMGNGMPPPGMVPIMPLPAMMQPPPPPPPTKGRPPGELNPAAPGFHLVDPKGQAMAKKASTKAVPKDAKASKKTDKPVTVKQAPDRPPQQNQQKAPQVAIERQTPQAKHPANATAKQMLALPSPSPLDDSAKPKNSTLGKATESGQKPQQHVIGVKVEVHSVTLPQETRNKLEQLKEWRKTMNPVKLDRIPPSKAYLDCRTEKSAWYVNNPIPRDHLQALLRLQASLRSTQQ